MKTRNLFILLILSLLILASIADAQRTSRIFRPCSLTPSNPSKVEVVTADRIDIRTCTSTGGETNVDSATVRIGDVNQRYNGTRIILDDSAQTLEMNTSGFTTVGELISSGITLNGSISFANPTANHIGLARTVTPSGTTGNRTINAMAGTVNFAAGTASITVTNLIANATSLIFCTVQTNDATATACRVTDKGAGAFTIRLNANATAETAVAFWVTN